MNAILDGIDLSDKVCVVTGASSGLGRESARALVTAGAHVVLAARSGDALQKADAWIHEVVDGARTTTVHLDLTSLASVRAAAATIAELVPAVHVLMNNAGVMLPPSAVPTTASKCSLGQIISAISS
jgi:NAD(P)-dependent dehydrogenase (short-subunit alcohol dehydrogenase family)